MQVTDPDGPAMTWGMFAVGWTELGEMQMAKEDFEKNFDNIQEPFHVSRGYSCIGNKRISD